MIWMTRKFLWVWKMDDGKGPILEIDLAMEDKGFMRIDSYLGNCLIRGQKEIRGELNSIMSDEIKKELAKKKFDCDYL